LQLRRFATVKCGIRCEEALIQPQETNSMIEMMTGFPDNVVAFTATGKVTAEDYEQRLVPAVESALAKHRKVRLLYHLGDAFDGFEAGAMWEDAKVGLAHLAAWERIAMVTDVDWLRVATKAFGFAMPGEVRVFANAELDAARDWLVS
jgi:hypothetical protein